MQLDSFITETLKAVVKGVQDAQQFASENGSRMNPRVGKWDQDKVITTYFGDEEVARLVSTIEFDLAIAASSVHAEGGGTGVSVFAPSPDTKSNDIDTNGTVSRIKFSVSVALPSAAP